MAVNCIFPIEFKIYANWRHLKLGLGFRVMVWDQLDEAATLRPMLL